MKKSRADLDKYFERCLVTYVTDIKTTREVVQACLLRFGLPPYRSQTILQMEASSLELRDHEIYWVLSAIKDVVSSADINLQLYFTDYEIDNYDKLRYSEGKVKFPIVLDMSKVSDDQYTGGIKASTLVAWRNGGLIRYNKELQRRLTTVVRGGKAYEVITLNSKSVKEMVGCFQRGEFVPNTITLNISEDEMDFYYDEDSHSLVINSVKHLDLTDGYHRLVALTKVIEANPSFDYDMELRITNFSDTKAGNFIGQEEKHVPIPKQDIRTFDMNNLANKITRKINDTPMCNLTGAIVRGGRVDFAAFAEMVEELYIKPMNEDDVKKAIVTVPKDMIESINMLTESFPSFLEKKFTVMEVRMLVYVCSLFKGGDKGRLTEIMDKLINYDFTTQDRQILSSRRKISKVVNHLNNIVTEEGWYGN